jgi:predicted DNA-binding transcriptional regulator AlpA
MRDTQSDDPLLDTAQAAEHLKYSKSALEYCRCQGTGPRFYKTAGRVRFRKSDLDAWINAGLVETRGR